MSDLSIGPISNIPNNTYNTIKNMPIDMYSVRNVMVSSTLTEPQKLKFLNMHRDEIHAMLKVSLTSDEYNMLISNRPLLRDKPITNIIRYRGDKILMAKALGVGVNQLNAYIDEVTNSLDKAGNLSWLPDDKANMIKTYIYRHGKKNQLISFFNYELSKSGNIEQTLHQALEYGNNSVADYFARPVHRMSKDTMIKLLSTIMKHIVEAKNQHKISEMDTLDLSQYVLGRIYVLQSNSGFIPGKKVKDLF